TQIKRSFIPSTAGYGDLLASKKFWNSLGWKSPGYHRVIDLEGNILNVAAYENITNSVTGHIAASIHIAYLGGVGKQDVTKATDTRNDLQKQALICAIEEAIDWVVDHGGNKSKIEILGHRDISPDKNGNGIIESWERIKECPSFDAIPEYEHLKGV